MRGREHYESLVETLEILEDIELMAVIRKSIDEAGRGETIPWAEAKNCLDL